jgi:hypothetical protein
VKITLKRLENPWIMDADINGIHLNFHGNYMDICDQNGMIPVEL